MLGLAGSLFLTDWPEPCGRLEIAISSNVRWLNWKRIGSDFSIPFGSNFVWCPQKDQYPPKNDSNFISRCQNYHIQKTLQELSKLPYRSVLESLNVNHVFWLSHLSCLSLQPTCVRKLEVIWIANPQCSEWLSGYRAARAAKKESFVVQNTQVSFSSVFL